MLLDKAIIKLDIHNQPYARIELKQAKGTKYLLDNNYKQCSNKNYYQNGEIYFSYNRYLKCFISDSYYKHMEKSTWMT
jgi:hypothetical protein